MESLEPRSLLPLPEQEIRQLYVQAIKASPHLVPSQVSPKPSTVSYLLDWCLYVSIAALLAPFEIRFAIALVVTVVFAFVATGSREAAGIVSKFWPNFGQVRHEPIPDLESREVLEIVVRYLTDAPLRQYKQIEHRVRTNRIHISDSLQALSSLIDELFVEGTSSEDTLGLLRRSRLDQAQRSKAKLEELDTHLAVQLKEAEATVAPIREVERHFYKMLQISDDLSKIQSAHGLIDDTEASIADNRIQIRLLKSLSQNAVESLQNIEQEVKARELAENEVMSLRT